MRSYIKCHTQIVVYVSMCICVDVYTSIYVYMYICVYVSTHSCIYMYVMVSHVVFISIYVLLHVQCAIACNDACAHHEFANLHALVECAGCWMCVICSTLRALVQT